jgi:hypothetical protein
MPAHPHHRTRGGRHYELLTGERLIVRPVVRHGSEPNGYSLDDPHHDSRGGLPLLRRVRARRIAYGHTELHPMTVLIYVDTSKQVGDRDHLKVFANADAAETWFAENDPEGVAFEYEILE